MPSSASTPSCEGCRHDHPHRDLQRLCAQSTSQRSPPCLLHTTHPLRPSAAAAPAPTAPASLPANAVNSTTPSLMPAASAPVHSVSTQKARAVVPQPTRQTAARAVLPDHLHRARSPPPLLSLPSQAGLPGPVQGVFTSSQTPRPRAALHRHRSARLYRYPAHLGPPAPVSSPYPLHGPGRRTLTGA